MRSAAFFVGALLSCHAATPAPDSGTAENGVEFNGVANTPTPPTSAASVPAPRTGATADDHASRMALKRSLEQKVSAGRATDAEINLLISTCNDLGDKPCVEQARALRAPWQTAN